MAHPDRRAARQGRAKRRIRRWPGRRRARDGRGGGGGGEEIGGGPAEAQVWFNRKTARSSGEDSTLRCRLRATAGGGERTIIHLISGPRNPLILLRSFCGAKIKQTVRKRGAGSDFVAQRPNFRDFFGLRRPRDLEIREVSTQRRSFRTVCLIFALAPAADRNRSILSVAIA